MKSVYLLTGMPGTGKTSLIKQAIAEMGGRAGGFFTEEIRSEGVRRGFRLITLENEAVVIAQTGNNSRYRIGKYGVDIEGLDRVGVAALRKAALYSEVVIIDEIGKMELLSENFKMASLKIVDSGKKVLGTIMLKPNPWADNIKKKPQVKLINVTHNNHQTVLNEIREWIK